MLLIKFLYKDIDTSISLWKRICFRILEAYLISINVGHILESPYHPQSQGVIEAFNKIVQKSF